MRKAQNLYQEFTSTLDKAEATTCVRELGSKQLAKVGSLQVHSQSLGNYVAALVCLLGSSVKFN